MSLQVIEKSDRKLIFVVEGISVEMANAIRRIIISEIPVMAVDEVIILKNDSPLYDEIIWRRSGRTRRDGSASPCRASGRGRRPAQRHCGKNCVPRCRRLKLEIRISKYETTPKYEAQMSQTDHFNVSMTGRTTCFHEALCFCHFNFVIWDLFRISDIEFRI